MTDQDLVPISEFDPANTLTGSEDIPVVQDGVNRRTTPSALSDYLLPLLPDASTFGVFTSFAGVAPTIAADVTAIQSAGYTTGGKGEAVYLYDAAVDGTFVAANPRTSFLAEDGRGFRLRRYDVNPFMFGTVGDGTTDDNVALQAFFDFCSAYDVGTADVTGSFSSSVGLVVGRLTTPLTMVFRGRFNLTLTGSGLYGLTFQSWDAGHWEYMQITGTGSTSTYSSKTWMAAVLFDDSARNKIGYSRFSKFSFAGIIAGLNNNTLNNYGMVKASDCGSGARNGATWYGLVGNWTAKSDTGSAGSTGQTTILTVDTQPPSYIGGEDSIGPIGDAQFMVRITDVDGSTRLHHIKEVDAGAGTITVGPWVSSTATPAAFDYVYGGAVYLRGNDSNVSTFEMIDALRCGIGLAATSLYSPTGQRVVTQFCGCGIMFGRYPGGAILGGKISGAYFEHNIEDIIMLSRSGGSVYNIVDSEYALNLGKCYCAGAPRLADNSFSLTYSNFNRLRLSYQGRVMQFEKQSNNAFSNNTFEITRPDMVIPIASNSPTVTIASLDRDLHRLFGFDTARVVIVGTGSNGAPTGTVTFPVPSNPDAIWTLNGGASSVTFTDFDGPGDFVFRFDVPTLNATVTRVRQKAQSILATAVKTGSYTAVPGDFVPVDSTSGTRTITLPTAPSDGAVIAVKLIAGANTVTINAGGSDVFNVASGATSATITVVNQTLTFRYKTSGAIWYVESGLSLGALDTRYSTLAANNQTGTTYTLVLTDAGKVVEENNASAITLTIPLNSSVAFPVGTVIEVYQQGAGQVTITATGGVTLRAPAGAKTATQYATVALWKRATDEWVLSGSTTT